MDRDLCNCTCFAPVLHLCTIERNPLIINNIANIT